MGKKFVKRILQIPKKRNHSEQKDEWINAKRNL